MVMMLVWHPAECAPSLAGVCIVHIREGTEVWVVWIREIVRIVRGCVVLVGRLM